MNLLLFFSIIFFVVTLSLQEDLDFTSFYEKAPCGMLSDGVKSDWERTFQGLSELNKAQKYLIMNRFYLRFHAEIDSMEGGEECLERLAKHRLYLEEQIPLVRRNMFQELAQTFRNLFD